MPLLAKAAPALFAALATEGLPGCGETSSETVRVAMRDGTILATDIYLPAHVPAPVLIRRTPYGRAKRAEMLRALAHRGYVVVSQDVRGTGDSEPDYWPYYVFEPEDSFDLVEWVAGQSWCGRHIGGFGPSYLSSTQWCMAAHPRMSAIAPEVGGLGIDFNSAQHHMFLDAYAKTVGNGANRDGLDLAAMEAAMLPETMASGYFNAPLVEPASNGLLDALPALRGLPPHDAKKAFWSHFTSAPPAERLDLLRRAFDVEQFSFRQMEMLHTSFGHGLAFGAHSLPSTSPRELVGKIIAPALLISGWYDWNLNDTLHSFDLLTKAGSAGAAASRLLIAPSAHNMPGYLEGTHAHPELKRAYNTADLLPVIDLWNRTVDADDIRSWPKVVYYLLGRNEWRCAPAWPPPEAKPLELFLHPDRTLNPTEPVSETSVDYRYDPDDPAPTIGGSIVSYVFTPGSADISALADRDDVVTYMTEPLAAAIDVVGPVRLTLYAGSSAPDTDFAARLSDVFPDGRAIQLQSGFLRTRFREPANAPQALDPDSVYRLDIDLWATANRFEAGHRLRLDVTSADFPRFDRNANQAGEAALPQIARQRIYHGGAYASRLTISILPASGANDGDAAPSDD